MIRVSRLVVSLMESVNMRYLSCKKLGIVSLWPVICVKGEGLRSR